MLVRRFKLRGPLFDQGGNADTGQPWIVTHLLIYQSSNRQAVEAVCECLPQAYVVPPFALIIESIDPVDGGTLMIASQQEEVFGVLDLQIQQSCECCVGHL